MWKSRKVKLMKKKLVYSSSLNGAAFLLFELEQVLRLKAKGLLNDEIRSIIVEENLFQYKNIGRVNRALPSVMRRADTFDDTLLDIFRHGTIDDRKVMNLYSIMKTDLLFFEFMNEVIRTKILDHVFYIEKIDLNVFFSDKKEQNDRVASWSEINIEKLKRAYMQVLFESGLLKTRQGKDLIPLFLEDDLKQHLIRIGDKKYVQAMGDNDDL